MTLLLHCSLSHYSCHVPPVTTHSLPSQSFFTRPFPVLLHYPYSLCLFYFIAPPPSLWYRSSNPHTILFHHSPSLQASSPFSYIILTTSVSHFTALSPLLLPCFFHQTPFFPITTLLYQPLPVVLQSTLSLLSLSLPLYCSSPLYSWHVAPIKPPFFPITPLLN